MTKRKKNIIIIADHVFLVHSTMRIGKYINYLGFWQKNGKWESHVSTFNILAEQEKDLIEKKNGD